jgi:K(+)-stimulated pyrophosphate-energized sodium pump
LLAVELSESLKSNQQTVLSLALAVTFLVISMFFVYRSFYGMRIVREGK